MASQAPALAGDSYTLSDAQQAVAQQVLARLQLSRSRVLLQSYDRLQRQYDAIVAIESLAHFPNVAATLRHWAGQFTARGVIVIIDELFRPEVSPAHPEIQRFMPIALVIRRHRRSGRQKALNNTSPPFADEE